MLKSLATSVVLAFALAQAAHAAEPTVKLKVGKSQVVPQDPALHDGKVNMDFPEPTDIKDVARAVALWTGKQTPVTSALLQPNEIVTG